MFKEDITGLDTQVSVYETVAVNKIGLYWIPPFFDLKILAQRPLLAISSSYPTTQTPICNFSDIHW